MTIQSRKKLNGPDAAMRATDQTSLTGGLDMLEAQIELWRQSVDLSRRMMRQQQDQMLQLWRTQLSQLGEMLPDGAAAAAPPMFTPILASLNAAKEKDHTTRKA